MFKAFVPNENEKGIIEVRGVPFGGPNDRDIHGQYFSENTDFLDEILPLPPVFHYHGAKTGSLSSPVAETLSRTAKSDGIWYKVKLFVNSTDDVIREKAHMLWESAKAGKLFASSGSVEAAIKITQSGEILQWLVGELSLINTGNPREFPANFHATVSPVKMGDTETGEITLESMRVGRYQDQDGNKTTDDSNPSTTSNTTRSEKMPDEKTPDVLAQLQAQVSTLMTQVGDQTTQIASLGGQVQARDAQIVQLQNVVTTKSAEVEMKNHETLVDGWIAEGLVSPAEREAALTVMAFAFQADMATKGDVGFENAIKAWVAVRPKNPLVGPPAGVFTNSDAPPTTNPGGSIDPANIERLKKYADLAPS